MTAPQASSRLQLLQARFQQKQLQEKEQKLLQLYDQQQQRAYQVVQRGSAGSNGSNHSSSTTHHTVTKTSSSSHTTSTLQGGKVRQMFDERRQTGVKGIDRSYPLEPLENKPRKATNGNNVQRNGNLTVNQQSTTVRRVVRADVNSNLNGGKPIVSYHEKIARESFSSGKVQEPDDNDDEFGNENHVTEYENGNQTHIEEVLDDDTIERNRMMAKLHLMEYDDTLKHRIKNDLNSEEFPEDLMVDVPDKLPKRNLTKKLSQAEVRLERFKNTNANRSNGVTKNPGIVSKKRSDSTVPTKSTCSENKAKTWTTHILNKGSNSEVYRGSGSNVKGVSLKNMEDSGNSIRWRNTDLRVFDKGTKKLMDSTSAKQLKEQIRQSRDPKCFGKESKKLAMTDAIDIRITGRLCNQFKKNSEKHSCCPECCCKRCEKLTTMNATNSKNIIKQRGSSKVDSKVANKLSDELLQNKVEQKENTKSVCKESKKSIGSEVRSTSPIFLKNRMKRSESPKFFCKESEKSATIYAIDSKPRSVSPNFIQNMEYGDIKTEAKDEESIPVKLDFNNLNKTPGINAVNRNVKVRNSEEISKSSPLRSIKSKITESRAGSKANHTKLPNVVERLTKKCNSSPEFLQTTTKNTNVKFIPNSPDLIKMNLRKRNKRPESPQTVQPKSADSMRKFSGGTSVSSLYTSDSENFTTKPESLSTGKQYQSSKALINKPNAKEIMEPRRRMSTEIVDTDAKYSIRNSVSRFFSDQWERTSKNVEGNKISNVQSIGRDNNPYLPCNSSSLSLKDIRTPSPISQKAISSTDRSCDSSPNSKRSSRSLSPELNSRFKPSGTTVQKSIDRSGAQSKREFSKSPNNFTTSKDTNKRTHRGPAIMLRSTKLIRDSMKHQSNTNYGNSAARFNLDELVKTSTTCDICQNVVGISNTRLKTNEESNKVNERSSTPATQVIHLSTPGSSPKSSTSVEVDTEIQEITIPDQHIECMLRSGTSKSRDKIPNCEKLKVEKQFAYSVRKPSKKMKNESNIFELSKGNHETTDCRKIYGNEECVGLSSPSTNNLTIYDVNSRTENVKMKQGIELEGLQPQKENILNERSKEKNNYSKGSIRSISSSSPTNVSTYKCSRHQIEKDVKVNREIEDKSLRLREGKMSKKDASGKKDNIKCTVRNVSSISPTNNLTFGCLQQFQGQKTIPNKLKIDRYSKYTMPEPKRKNVTKGLQEKTSSSNELKQNKGENVEQKKQSHEVINKTTISDETIGHKQSDSTATMKIKTETSVSSFICAENEAFANKDYEKMDSVKSALRQIDFISGDTTQSITEKRRMLEKRNDSRTTLKAIDRTDVNPFENIKSEALEESSKGDMVVNKKEESNINSKTQKSRDGRKFARARDSIEINRIVIKSKSPSCKRRLFQDTDFRKKNETVGLKLRCSLDLMDKCIPFGKSKSNKNSASNPNIELKRDEFSEKNTVQQNKFVKRDSDGTITGALPSLSVKSLKLIDDVQKSNDDESFDRKAKEQRTKSAIANDTLSCSNVTRSRRLESSVSDRAKSRKMSPLPKRSENFSARNDSLENTKGSSLKCAMRFTRITENSNPESLKAKKTSDRGKTTSSPPVKGSDTVTRKQMPSMQTGRPPSALSSVPNGSTMQSQISGSKGKMTSRAKTSTSSTRVSDSNGCKGNTPVPDGLIPCKLCGRRFAQNRVTLHEQICAKTSQKKRKQFDAVVHRIKGTDLEQFVRRGICKKPEGVQRKGTQSENHKNTKSKKPEPKSNWRRKHEEFINAIRSAKQVQAHLAAGGKLSDLPPPPASDTSDYIQCPHCGRKFNQAAAERHIPKCEHMLHNKPIHSRAPKPKR